MRVVIFCQDEADVFSILYYIGRSHGKFSSRIMKEISLQVSMLLYLIIEHLVFDIVTAPHLFLGLVPY